MTELISTCQIELPILTFSGIPTQTCKFSLPSSIKLYRLKNEVLSLQVLRQSVSTAFPIEWMDI